MLLSAYGIKPFLYHRECSFPFFCNWAFLIFCFVHFDSILAIDPSNLMSTLSSSISACMKEPGMPRVAKSLRSWASMMQEIINASVATVGDIDSCFFMYEHCRRPSAHPLLYIEPFLFSFCKIRYDDASCSLDLIGLQQTLGPSSSLISLRTAATLSFLKWVHLLYALRHCHARIWLICMDLVICVWLARAWIVP